MHLGDNLRHCRIINRSAAHKLCAVFAHYNNRFLPLTQGILTNFVKNLRRRTDNKKARFMFPRHIVNLTVHHDFIALIKLIGIGPVPFYPLPKKRSFFLYCKRIDFLLFYLFNIAKIRGTVNTAQIWVNAVFRINRNCFNLSVNRDHVLYDFHRRVIKPKPCVAV